jgi:hypothetical protein
MAERIGEYFLRIGVMNSEQIAEVLKLQETGDRRVFGDIAFSLGYVDAYALKAYADFTDAKNPP